jgi:hypothetical protein
LAKEAKMKKNVFLMGILSVALVFGTALFVGCDSGDSGPSTPAFDGASLAGTKWVYEGTEDMMGMTTITVKATLKFTSDTAGEVTVAITKWDPDPGAETKTKLEGMITEDNGAFTSTYTAASKSGTYTLKSETTGTFTVDVSGKTLTTTDDDDKEEITVYKLQ